MLASVIIEYSAKSLNRVFDYIIPDELKDIIKVGHKVIVPFASKEVEGFTLKIHNNFDKEVNYKSIIRIQDSDFYLNDELLKLGKYMSNTLLCNLISCYQAMLPKALKASIKTNINKKTETKVSLNKDVDIDTYILEHKRNKKEIELLNYLKDKEEIKSKINCPSLKKLIDNGIVLETVYEVNRNVDFEEEKDRKIVLNDEQKNAIKEILNSKDNKFLIYGVTGSGKTEIYIDLIRNMIKEGKSSIVLVPEISLTPQIVSRFKNVFGDSVAVFHSSLSEGEKYDEYRRIMNGEVDFVVGARSAIFAPLKNIGIIIIDECQSTTYKQESTPKYNAIDIAFKRSEYNKSKVILGSATPLLEQYARAVKGIYKLVELKSRVSKNMPVIKLVDMNDEVKKRNFIISSELDKEIRKCLMSNEQVILLLNRRGYSTFISCSNCGYVYKCPNCDISLIYHKSSNNLTCHYCGYQKHMNNICPQCHENAIKDLGLGTEKLEELIKSKYNARVLRMDADTTSRKGSYEKLIDEFSKHNYDILIGTQMISKGLNFKDVTLVGIINIDASLAMPDFRSSERTFELLLQTAGRTARFEKTGKVIIQTYNKDNYVFKYLLSNSYISFYNAEMNFRKKLKYIPYYNLIVIKITSASYEEASSEAKKVYDYLSNTLNDNFIILGPSLARIFKLKNKYNFSIIIKYKYEENLFEVLKNIRDNYKSNKVLIDIDINPINML
jgi:primosomal protein N' (replication factor Y)